MNFSGGQSGYSKSDCHKNFQYWPMSNHVSIPLNVGARFGIVEIAVVAIDLSKEEKGRAEGQRE